MGVIIISTKEYILYLLDKYKLMNLRQITILSGARDDSVVRKKLNSLIKEGFIVGETYGKRKVYAVTQRGLNYIGSDSRLYEIKGYSTEHTLQIVYVACYLYLHYLLSNEDMRTDREFGRRLSHKPDLIFGASCVEIELNAKENTRFLKNIRLNSEEFVVQFWVIPVRLRRLEKVINNYSIKLGTYSKVLFLEDVVEAVENYNLKGKESVNARKRVRETNE